MSEQPEDRPAGWDPSPWAAPGSPGQPPPAPPVPRYEPRAEPVSGYGAPGYGAPGYGPPPYPAARPISPGYGPPSGYGPVQPANPAAIRVDVIEGTPFGVAYPAVPPTQSGPSIGSLVAGIASILVSFVVGCFGISGASSGWGPAVSGAFAILAAFIGAGGVGMGVYGLRQIRRSNGTVRGRGMAIAGISCGATGIGLTVLLFVIAVAATAGNSSTG